MSALGQILSKSVASQEAHNELLSLGIIRASDNILLFMIYFIRNKKYNIPKHSNIAAVVLSNVFILESCMNPVFFLKTKNGIQINYMGSEVYH